MDPLASGARFDARLKVRALGALFAAGATLVLITIALPHAAGMSETGLLVVCVNAYLIAGAMIGFPGILPERLLPIVLAWGAVLVTAVSYFSGEAPSPLVFFYLWVFLYAAYFFGRTWTLVQIVLVGAMYAGLLALKPPPTATEAWWIVGMGALSVAAALIVVMRAHVDALVDRLHEVARSDALTGLQNRRGFRETLDLEMERCRRSGTTMALLVAELDHLALLNDQSGHAAGDQAMRRAARVLSSDHRCMDACARIAREEFALVLPDTGERGASRYAERIRAEIAQEFAGEALPLTLSVGIATFPDLAETASSLLRTADAALQAAKNEGGNRAVVHSPDLAGDARESAGPAKEIEAERFLATVLDLAEAVDIRFSGSGRHCETVGRYAETMARALGLPKERVHRIRLAGVLHDVGKVGVPDAILGKPGSLTDEEWVTMKGHAALGAQILEHPSLADIQSWVGAHHERLDGKGYPLGLAGDEIPLEARILAVADAYEAMTSTRSYRASLSPDEAHAELRRCAGTQFDPAVVAAFIGGGGDEPRAGVGLSPRVPAPALASATQSPARA